MKNQTKKKNFPVETNWKNAKRGSWAIGISLCLSVYATGAQAQNWAKKTASVSNTNKIIEASQLETESQAPLTASIGQYAKLITSTTVDQFDFDGDVNRFNGRVVDVTVLNSSLAIVTARPDDTHVSLFSVKINTNNTLTILSTLTFTEAVYALKIVKLDFDRICVVQGLLSFSPGLKLKVYDVNTSTGSFTSKGSATAGYTADIDATVMFVGNSSRVVTSVKTLEGHIKHIVWDINDAGTVTRQGEAQTDDSSLPKVVAVTSSKIITGVRQVSNSDMKLQLWQLSTVGGKITPVLKDTEVASDDVTDLGLTKLTTTRFATAIKQSNNSDNQKTIVWDLTGTSNNTITRRSSTTNSDITQLDVCTVVSGLTGRVITAAIRKTGGDAGKLYMGAYDVTSTGGITNDDLEVGDLVGQVRVEKLNSTRYFTAYTRSSDSRLVLVAWDVTGSAPVDDVTTNTNQHTMDQTTSLEQNYPNPANGLVQFPINISKSGKVTLEILNITGQKVATVFAGDVNPGRHVKQFNTNSIPAGVYLYQLKTSEGNHIKRMTITK